MVARRCLNASPFSQLNRSLKIESIGKRQVGASNTGAASVSRALKAGPNFFGAGTAAHIFGDALRSSFLEVIFSCNIKGLIGHNRFYG
jgi:hypothetical protein